MEFVADTIYIIPFVLASFGSLVLSSFGSLVLSYVTPTSGGAASPGLGGQRTPRGKDKGKDMGFGTMMFKKYQYARPSAIEFGCCPGVTKSH